MILTFLVSAFAAPENVRAARAATPKARPRRVIEAAFLLLFEALMHSSHLQALKLSFRLRLPVSLQEACLVVRLGMMVAGLFQRKAAY
jgi:hypothetical protein